MATFNKYYQDELAYLRELGKEFSEAFPALAPMLAEDGEDPDVKQLLEGFAFLSGRIREKLDDDYPEFTHALVGLLWPHALRPIPSVTTIQFEPIPGVLRDRYTVESGVDLDSIPVSGVTCRFRTVGATHLYPLRLASVQLENPGTSRAQLRMGFQLPTGVTAESLNLTSLRLHLAATSENAMDLYLWFSRHVAEVEIEAPGSEGVQRRTLGASAAHPVIISDEEPLWPYPKLSFPGYRLLQEYFAYPSRFLYIDLDRLDAVKEICTGNSFDVIVRFDTAPELTGRLEPDDIRLYCTPAVNLFQDSADPFRLRHDRVEYRLRPPQGDTRLGEIFSIDEVQALPRGKQERDVIPPLFRFSPPEASSTPYYQTRVRESVVGGGVDQFISFVYPDGLPLELPDALITADVTMTNGNLPEALRTGDIRVATDSSPQVAKFNNIARPTATIRPPLGGGLHWRLVSHMGLSQLTLNDEKAFQGVLDLYNVQAYQDRQMGRANEKRIRGIRSLTRKPEERLLRGSPIRGTLIEMEINEEGFSGEGDLYLFASVLNEFLSMYSTVNAFTRLRVRCVQSGEVYEWPARLGSKSIL